MRFEFETRLQNEGTQERYEIDAPAPPGSPTEYVYPVQGTITLMNTGGTMLADVDLHTKARMECSRCLSEHDVDIDIRVNENVILQELDQPQSYYPQGEEQLPIPILNDEDIDFSELVRQLLSLHLPPRSLCKPDCKGLCPKCGQNLNEGTCDCAETEVDPRLEALADVFDEEQ
ncbi:MAG: DUF177 domain-containing protein [Armatimonadota bacterium]